MALSDLELLQLVEQAKEKQRGPKGEPGIGIQSIEQFDGDSFTIKLTDGNFKKIDLPAGKDGEVGATGPAGERGAPGAAGSRGAAGSDGAPGRDGKDGAPGVSVDTGVVNPEGQLLIGLSDGSTINLGNVRGPAGATGERGPTGLPGAAGEDGAAVLSGPRTPTQDDGQEGDHWIDISSAEFNFYKKSGTGWSMLASLRQPGKNPAVAIPVGNGVGGGSAGGKLQTTATLPLANPTRFKPTGRLPDSSGLKSQKDLNEWIYQCLQAGGGDGANVSVGESPPVDAVIGDLYFCNKENDLTLYIYLSDDDGWVPASPPVSLDGIESSIANVDAELMKVNANIAMNKRDIDEAVLDIQEDQKKQDDGIGANARDITQLRSRVGDLEAGTGGGDFLPLAGGELKGTLEINGSRDKDGKINSLLCRADGYYMSFGVNKDGEVFAGSSEGQPFLATTNWHVVTKAYLDQQVATAGLRTLRYKYKGGYKPEAWGGELKPGEFCKTDSHFYVHHTSLDGIQIMKDPEENDYWTGSYWVHAYSAKDNSKGIQMHFKSLTFSEFSKHEYIEFHSEGKILGKNNMHQNEEYYLRLGGFF